MRSVLLAAVLAIPGVFAGLAAPQNSPREAFNGSWVFMPNQASSSLPAATNPALGARLDIAIDGNTLVLTRPSGTTSYAVTYPLDGSRVRYPLSGQLCEGEHTMYDTAVWEGEALVITSVGLAMSGTTTPSPIDNRRVLRREGDRLVVESSVMRQGERRQVASVFERTTTPLPRPAPAPVGVPTTIASAAWLSGQWEGTTKTVTTEERWTPAVSGGMIGIGRTIVGGSLSAFEFLCIAERNGSLAYLAMPGARTPATVFMATEVTPTSITFENPSHDYPKLIRYAQTPDGGLETTIAGANGARTAKVTLKRAGQ